MKIPRSSLDFMLMDCMHPGIMMNQISLWVFAEHADKGDLEMAEEDARERSCLLPSH